MGHFESPEGDFGTSEQQTETSTVLLQDAGQGRGDARIVQVQSPQDLNLDAEVKDALAGDRWSDASKALFQKLFTDAVHDYTAPVLFGQKLVLLILEINGRVKSELENQKERLPKPVDMQMKGIDGSDGAFLFYVILSKDQTAKTDNQQVVNDGGSSDTVIKLGPLSMQKHI